MEITTDRGGGDLPRVVVLRHEALICQIKYVVVYCESGLFSLIVHESRGVRQSAPLIIYSGLGMMNRSFPAWEVRAVTEWKILEHYS